MNKQWEEFRERLYDHGYTTLWQIRGKPLDLAFDLVCLNTEKGATIFQVWKDAGFQVYTDSGPNEVEGMFNHLTKAAEQLAPEDGPLATFARRALNLMEEDKEWSADTLDAIAQAAQNFGVAKDDAEGCFEVIR